MSDIKLLFRDGMNEEIAKIKEQNPNVKFYSHSRLGTFHQCKKSYYYTYIEKKPQKDGVYALLGTACHSSLEDVYDNKVNRPQKDIFQNEFDKCELFSINFPQSKYDIKGGYYKDISAFYDVYKKIETGKAISELGFLLRVDEDHIMMGYIDLLILNEDGTADIVDFKTSSSFDNAEKLKKAGNQLVLYAMAIEQLYGIKVNTVSWEMLKYVTVQVGSNKPKENIKGREWVNKCSAQIKTLMKKKGYDEFLIDMYLAKAVQDNSIDSLPDDIKQEIKVNVYRRYYEVTDYLKDDLTNYIKETINDIENMDKDNPDKWECSVDKFFCGNLCSFSCTYCNYWEHEDK